jgi:hypothetical protein
MKDLKEEWLVKYVLGKLGISMSKIDRMNNRSFSISLDDSGSPDRISIDFNPQADKPADIWLGFPDGEVSLDWNDPEMMSKLDDFLETCKIGEKLGALEDD